MWQTKISDVSHFPDYKTTAKKRRVDQKTLDRKIPYMEGEWAERNFYDHLITYLKQEKGKPNDCLILIGQKIMLGKKSYQRDFLLLHLTSKCILNVECKFTLSRSEVTKGLQQLSTTNEVLRCLFGGEISEDWKMIKLLYGETITSDLDICENCRSYILTPENVSDKLKFILSPSEDLNFESAPSEFRMMAGRLVAKGVAIQDDIINRICSSIDVAGSPANVSFWSPDQLDLVVHQPRKVCLTSSFSTGKTVLMLGQAKILLDAGEKVKFLFHQHVPKKLKTLLQIRIEKDYKSYIDNGLFEVGVITDKLFIDFNFQNDCHVFIDEVILFERMPVDPDSLSTSQAITDHINRHETLVLSTLKKWHDRHDPNKYLWITITAMDRDRGWDFDHLKMSKFYIPTLTYPFRNAAPIVEWATKIQQELYEPGICDLEVGPRGFLKANWTIDIPDNHPRTIEPIPIETKEINDGLRAAFKEVYEKTHRNNFKALVIIVKSITENLTKTPNPYANLRQAFIDARRPLPLLHCYLQSDNEHEIQDWITNQKLKMDLIVDYSTSRGYENEIVFIVKKSGNEASPNTVMRTRALLVIISCDGI